MTETVLTPPRLSAGPAPVRTPRSIRRTTSIDVSWPDGRMGDMRLDGRARDVVTAGSGDVVERREDRFVARLRFDRTITSIESDPPRPAIAQLVGQRAGGHLRQALKAIVPEELSAGTPLYLILDDMSGASLVAGWAWSHWNQNWMKDARASLSEAELAKIFKPKEGICIGFAPGSSALRMDVNPFNGSAAPDLRNAADADGWHDFTDQSSGAGFRRARRIDVSLSNVITIEAAFQDSASTPEGERKAIHEYRLSATADPATRRILTLSAEPRVLPFGECPSASANLTKLVGESLSDLRDQIPQWLGGTAGCTHLNDALRALSDAPLLAERLLEFGDA